MVQGDPDQALAYTEEILSALAFGENLDGVRTNLSVYLNCYRILCAVGDPRAELILGAAHRLIQERASKINDQALRRSYLENVAENREIVTLWEETSHQ